jgi:hypothetical protein
MKYRITGWIFLDFLVTGLAFSGITTNGPMENGSPVLSFQNQAPILRFDLNERWSICLPASPHKVLVRAAKDLQDFLHRRHNLALKISEKTADCGIVLGLEDPQKEDGFTLRADSSKSRVTITGSNPRAVFQGVLVLEDHLSENSSLPRSLNETVTLPFKDRYILWDSLLTGQNKGAIGFDLERHVREAVRLGYTGMECNRFVGMTIIQQGHPRDPYPWYTYWGPSMDQFVTSPLFEGVFPKDYLARNLADLKHVVEVVDSFGLKPIFMGYEPRYVPEEFLKQRPDLRGPRVDHPLRSMAARYSLCTDQPEVQQHYRTLARRLAEEVPAIREMHIIFHDSGTGFCWAHGLYSGCNGPERCRLVPTGDRMRNFFMAVKQGLRDGGLDIPLVAQAHGISRPEVDQFFSRVPKDVEFTSGNWSSWSIAYRDPLEADRYVISRQRETGRRRLYYQQHFFGFDGAPTSEFPVPYILAERLKTAQGFGLDVLSTLGGIVSPPIKERSVMQEVYRRFLLEPNLPTETLVEHVAQDLAGNAGAAALTSIWKNIHTTLEKNGRQIGFAMGTEYTARRTLVRPLVPEASALSPDEQEWWLAYTFAGNLRFGHAHLFRGEGGLPTQEWYTANLARAARAGEAFRQASSALQAFAREHPDVVRAYPYLISHERQLRFLGYVYSTGMNLYEGQRILDKYSKKEIEPGLTGEVNADLARFQAVVENEIENTRAFLKLVEEGGDIGMVLLPQETTWGYGANLPELLRRKIEIMKRHLPEAEQVLKRWFGAEY